MVSYSTLLNFVDTEAKARAVLDEMRAAGITPDVVSYNTLLNFVDTEAKARAVLDEMRAAGITPDVVSYSTLLNFVDTEAKARAVLDEMRAAGITPEELSVALAVKQCSNFEEAMALTDYCLDQGWFVGPGAYGAVYSFPIAHMSGDELLNVYFAKKYKFDTALEGPINQYRKAGMMQDATRVALVGPQTGAAQRLFRQRYDDCRSFFDAEFEKGEDGDNLYYAYGIAAALNGDWTVAVPMLEVARERAYAPKRQQHIDRLLNDRPAKA